MSNEHSSIVSIAALVLFFTLSIVAKNNAGANAKPVLNYENQLRNKLNQIDREGDETHYSTTVVNHRSKSLTNFGEQSYGLSNESGGQRQHDGGRAKRELDLNIGADHIEGAGTDVTASVSATLYRSVSGETRLDGSAQYRQHIGDSDYGKAQLGGALRFRHRYYT